MAFSLRRLSLSAVISCLKRARCYDLLPPPAFCIAPLSTLSTGDVLSCGESSCGLDEQCRMEPVTSNVDEFEVLNELSDLLPIRHGSGKIYSPFVPVPPKNQNKSLTNVAHDGLLPPEDELQGVLPICHGSGKVYSPFVPGPPKNQNKSLTNVAHDGLLTPEDKLRGVFLQKLNGKAAIEKDLAGAIANMSLTLDIVSKVVDRGNIGGEAMVMFFNWAIEQPTIQADLSTYHVILKALGRRKFFKLMVAKLHNMCAQGISPTCETLMIVMDSFVRARQVSKAVDIFKNLEEFGMKCETSFFNVLLRSLCVRSYAGTANSLLNSMKGMVEFDMMTYNVVIDGWSRLGRVGEMEATLKAMVDHGFDPDSLTYSYLIEGFGKAGQIDDAVRIFKSMDDHDCLPDTCVYNAMIANYISIRNFGECMKYYEQMLSSDCLPNADTYTKLIGSFLKARKVADALELFDEMLNRGIVPTTGTITCFIETLCSYGPSHAAMVIYKGARKIGCRISLKAYKLLLARLSRFGKCGMLLTLWHEMQASYSSDAEVYECIINGLCNNGQLDTAVLVMEEFLQKGFCPSRIICSKLNNKLMAAKKVQEAYKLFLKIKVARGNENARKYWRANGWHI